jgi:hypothetical protein
MSRTQRAVVLLAVQAALVLSVAGKYLYERKVCPRIWVKAAQYDPDLALRGRYFSLQLVVDACALPRDQEHHSDSIIGSNPPDPGSWRWDVNTVVEDGKLVPKLASDNERPELTHELRLWGHRPCDQAQLSENVEYFITDTAKSPFPVEGGAQLWVEVTIPPMGPPRPIQLALSKDGTFTPLNLH